MQTHAHAEARASKPPRGGPPCTRLDDDCLRASGQLAAAGGRGMASACVHVTVSTWGRGCRLGPPQQQPEQCKAIRWDPCLEAPRGHLRDKVRAIVHVCGKGRSGGDKGSGWAGRRRPGRAGQAGACCSLPPARSPAATRVGGRAGGGAERHGGGRGGGSQSWFRKGVASWPLPSALRMEVSRLRKLGSSCMPLVERALSWPMATCGRGVD